jgi:hypothetical protein
MHRFIFWLLVLLLGVGLCALLFLKFTVPREDSTVYLKAASSEPIVGQVDEKEKYIVVTKNGFQQMFPWDEIKSISGPQPLPAKAAIFGYWVDKLDFLSSLGVIAALIVFSAGLYQYQQGLVWKREEFLAGFVTSSESPSLTSAREMLESLAQERSAKVQLDSAEKDQPAVYVAVTKEEIIKSLAAPIQTPSDKELKIRAAFDSFLDRFEILDGYVSLRVVSKRSVQVQMGYWLDLLGRHDKLDPAFRTQLVKYAEFYGYEGFLRLINRYNRIHRFQWRMRGLVPRKR